MLQTEPLSNQQRVFLHKEVNEDHVLGTGTADLDVQMLRKLLASSTSVPLLEARKAFWGAGRRSARRVDVNWRTRCLQPGISLSSQLI